MRGQERFNIFCAPCHGRLGDGNGMIVQRGYKQAAVVPRPAAARLARRATIFDVMTNGFGQMPSYAAQIPPEDRWAIVAYIRALQLVAERARLADARRQPTGRRSTAPSRATTAPATPAPAIMRGH